MSKSLARTAARLATAGLVVLGVSALTVDSAVGSRAIELKVRKSNERVAGDVRIQVSVEPDARNRTLLVVADSDEFYRSSEFTLDGEDAARTHWLDWYRLPAGQYEIQAVVRGVDGHRAATSQPLTILGFGADVPAAGIASSALTP